MPKTEGMNKYVVFEQMPRPASTPPTMPSRQSGHSSSPCATRSEGAGAGPC